MPTWGEVQEFARLKYRVANDTQDSFEIAFEYENDRRQIVKVGRFEAVNREWCDISSKCCSRAQLDPEVALKKNFGFALGALCLEGDVYVVRYSVQMASMDIDEFELPLYVVASTADRIE